MTNTNALKVLGENRVDMMLWDAGIQLYANVYYTTDQMLAEHGDVLTRYLTGSARGWGFAKENPEAAVDHLVAEYGNLDRASELDAVGPVLGFSFDGTTATEGWGAMNPEKTGRSRSTSTPNLEQFKGDVPTVGDVMTTDILAAIEALRKEIG